jgi:hypothetical protein
MPVIFQTVDSTIAGTAHLIERLRSGLEEDIRGLQLGFGKCVCVYQQLCRKQWSFDESHFQGRASGRTLVRRRNRNNVTWHFVSSLSSNLD